MVISFPFFEIAFLVRKEKILCEHEHAHFFQIYTLRMSPIFNTFPLTIKRRMESSHRSMPLKLTGDRLTVSRTSTIH